MSPRCVLWYIAPFIFSFFTNVLNLVEELLHVAGGDGSAFQYLRFDGQTSRARRDLNIRRFQDPASTSRVILISTRAGGQGITLTAATEVVFLDEDWNPQMTAQAEARAHRIGQKEIVTIYKIHTYGTVEQQMLGRIRKKQYLSAKIDASSRVDRNTEGSDTQGELDLAQLQSILRQGTLTLSRPQADIDQMTYWNLKAMIDNFGDHGQLESATAARASNEQSDQAWLTGVERVQSRFFEGQVHQNKKPADQSEDPVELLRADRRRNKQRTVKVGEDSVLKVDMTSGEGDANKNAALATPKRAAKAVFNHERTCMACYQAQGQITQCDGCPRVFHAHCLEPRLVTKLIGGIHRCSQHRCANCTANSNEAGGLLFACRDCCYSWCTDCLDEGHTLLDDELPQFAALGFPENSRTTYIICKGCTGAAAIHVYTNATAPKGNSALASTSQEGSRTTAIPLAPTLKKSSTADTPQTLKRGVVGLDDTEDGSSRKNARVVY